MKSMNDGFVRIAAVSPNTQPAAPMHNGEVCLEAVQKAAAQGANIVVLPECTLTSYISNDLLYHDELLQGAENALAYLIEQTAPLDVLVSVGIPLRVNSKLYNSVCIFHKGKPLAVIPKTHIPTYGVDFEGRWFEPGPEEITPISIAGFDEVPFGTNQLMRNTLMPELTIGAEICEDIWCPEPPSIRHALAGATVILNSSASNSGAGKADYRRGLIGGQSGRLICCYVYCSSGMGDSTSNVLVGGHDIIAQNGVILSESLPYEEGYTIADVDVASLCGGRRGMSSFVVAPTPATAGYKVVDFEMHVAEAPLLCKPSTFPFVPTQEATLEERCRFAFKTQIEGIRTKLAYLKTDRAFVPATADRGGILAVLATAAAFKKDGIDRAQITVELPHRTEGGPVSDALTAICEALGCTIATTAGSHGAPTALTSNDAVRVIVCPYDMTQFSVGAVAYPQNIVEHYGVNSTVAHTLIPSIIRYISQQTTNTAIRDALAPLSTNEAMQAAACESIALVPLAQKDAASDLPSECPAFVIDFFLSAFLDSKYTAAKTYRLAKEAFEGTYTSAQLLDWLRLFYTRFFATEYLRSSMPDGPRVASVTVSPRDDYMMPGGDCGALWIEAARALQA